jgi:opacity protein-like surface antigen
MKKLTLTAISAFALITAGANAKNFDGFNAGVRANYNWYKVDMKEQVSDNAEKVTTKPKGVSGDLVLGYLHNMGNDVVLGLEAYAGWANYEGKAKDVFPNPIDSQITIQRNFSYGLDLLAGYTFMDELLGYAKIGLNATQTKYKLQASATGFSPVKADFKKTVPGFSAGLGAKYAVSKEFTVDLGYTYTKDLKSNKLNVSNITLAQIEKGRNHAVHVGVSYQF